MFVGQQMLFPVFPFRLLCLEFTGSPSCVCVCVPVAGKAHCAAEKSAHADSVMRSCNRCIGVSAAPPVAGLVGIEPATAQIAEVHYIT